LMLVKCLLADSNG